MTGHAMEINLNIGELLNLVIYTDLLVERIRDVFSKGADYFKEKVSKFSDMGNNWSDEAVGKLVELGVISRMEVKEEQEETKEDKIAKLNEELKERVPRESGLSKAKSVAKHKNPIKDKL